MPAYGIKMVQPAGTVWHCLDKHVTIFLLLLYVYQFRMLNFVYISPSLSFSLPLLPFSLCIHPLIRYIIILSGVCDNGYFGCPIGISYCLGVGSFQYCIITNWCISDLWNGHSHSFSIHSSRSSITLLRYAVNILHCKIHQLQKRVGCLHM